MKWSTYEPYTPIRSLHDAHAPAPSWPKRLGVALLLAALLFGLTRQPAEAQEPPQWIADVIADRAEARGASAWVLTAVLRCESDHWDSRVFTGQRLGRDGEVGIAQLHPQGLLPAFFRFGYSDPFSAWQSVDFTARMLAAGEARHWSCWWTEVQGVRPPWWR